MVIKVSRNVSGTYSTDVNQEVWISVSNCGRNLISGAVAGVIIGVLGGEMIKR